MCVCVYVYRLKVITIFWCDLMPCWCTVALHGYSVYYWQCYYCYFRPSVHPSIRSSSCVHYCNFSFQFHFISFHLFSTYTCICTAFSSSSFSLHSDSTCLFSCVNRFATPFLGQLNHFCIHEYGKFNYLIKISKRYFYDIVPKRKKNRARTRQQTCNLRFGILLVHIFMPCNRWLRSLLLLQLTPCEIKSGIQRTKQRTTLV